ncbi:pentapeptide repeat-containing protein [Micromonospora chalcea]
MTRRLSVALMAVGGLVLLSVALVMVPRSWWGVVTSGWRLLVPVAGGLAVLVAGVLLWRLGGAKPEVSAAPTPPDRQVRPLRSWVIPAGAVLAGVVTWAAVSWLQGSVPAVGDQVERAKLRVESIRTGLTIGASVTAAFALLLAFRRQQLAERTQQATEYDAGEKRVTELYVKAADQLGSDKAPVRLAGLYALERLAQANPAHLQSIIEVICAYLRMPYTPPNNQPTPEPDDQTPPDDPTPAAPKDATGDSNKAGMDPREERQVRLAAQRILARHLRPTTPEGQPDPLYWDTKVTLDLTEAVLIDLDFSRCHLHNATFTKTHFTGTTRFGKATFGGAAWFDGATFGGAAWFDGATFGGAAWFDEATFSGDARFDEATFSGDAWFRKATLNGQAWYLGATFNGVSRFVGATVGSDAMFAGTTFRRDAWFGGARFVDAWFGGVSSGDSTLDGATFGGDAWFDGATFSCVAWFGGARFDGTASFGWATLAGARYDGPEPVAEYV